jgi:integrase
MTIQERTSKKGTTSFLIRVSLGYDRSGQRIVRSITWKPEKGMTQKQIEREVNRQAVLFEEKAKTEYEAEQKRKADRQMQEEYRIEYAKEHTTFQELADEWLELQEASNEYKHSSLIKLKGCKERTYKAIGGMLVSKLSFRKIQLFITSLAKDGVNQKTGTGLSIKSQKSYLTFISDVMLYAKRCGIIEHNPCRDIVFTKTESKDKTVYSLDEAKSLLLAIDSKAPTEYKLLFNLLAYCGMRKGEALGLEYKDIDFDKSVLTISRTSNYHEGYGVYTDTPKTKASYRTLYIQPKIIDLIKQVQAEQQERAEQCGDQWEDTDRLFVNWCGKPLHPNIPYKWLKRFCESESIPFKGLHSFRHFVATQALTSGVDVKSVSAMLGHSQTSTTLNVYAHAVQQANEKALNSVAALLETA